MDLSDARATRERLRNPPNAVEDQGIDLKRKVTTDIPKKLLLPSVSTHHRVAPAFEIADAPAIPQVIRINDIIRMVSRTFNVSVMEILSDRRLNQIVRPRHIAMWLSKELTTCSLPFIGRRFNGRDHSTILHAHRSIEKKRRSDPVLQSQLDQFIVALRSTRPENANGQRGVLPTQS